MSAARSVLLVAGHVLLCLAIAYGIVWALGRLG